MRRKWKSVGILGKVSIPDKRWEVCEESTLLLYLSPSSCFPGPCGGVRYLEVATNHHPWKCHHYLRMAEQKEKGVDP